MIKIIVQYLFQGVGECLSWFRPWCFSAAIGWCCDQFYTGLHRRRFGALGRGSQLKRGAMKLVGLQHVFVGQRTMLDTGLQLTAWCVNGHVPRIEIGSDCTIRPGAHITAIDSIRIGNHLLTGTNILITDNSHGSSTPENLRLPPTQRIVVSKGGVTIGDNVWLGNNVCVMPGVTIGDGTIVGTNSVVTHDLPPYCVAAGIPARVLKQYNVIPDSASSTC